MQHEAGHHSPGPLGLSAPISSTGSTRKDSPPVNYSRPPSDLDTTRAARQLLAESGLTAAQLGRLTGVTPRAVHHWASGSTPSARQLGRLRSLHWLVFSLDAPTPAERRALMLDSSQGPSRFQVFREATGSAQQIQFSIPVTERLG